MRKALLVLSLILGPILFAQNADLRITTFNISSELTQTGERFALELRWRNDGPAPARFVVVSVAGTPEPFYILSVATSGWPCYPTPDGTSFSCQNAQLDPGADAVLVLQMLTPATARPFTLRANVRAAENDPQPSNNSAERTIELQAAPAADLSLSPTTQTQIAAPGAAVTLPINIANNSDRRVNNVIAYVSVPVTDDLPPFEVRGEGWTCGHLAYGPQAVICTRNDLEPRESAPIIVTTTAPPVNGSFTLTARVRGEGHSDPFTVNDIATATVRVGSDDVPPPPPPPPPATWTRILIPVIGPDLPGTNNALWRTEVTALIAADNTIAIEPYDSLPGAPLPLPLRRPFDVYRSGLAGISRAVGEFLYIRPADASKLHLNARVYDASRTAQTAGSEIPIVREDDFTSTPVSILGIPVASHYRHTLRVYDLGAQNGGEVQIRIYANGETTPRLSTVRTLQVPQPPRNTVAGPQHPGVIQVELGQLTPLAGISSLRVDVEPVTPGLRLWSFVSVTNNDTHHVTTFSQH